MTALTMKTWGFCSTLRVPYQIFISWEPPSPRFLKVNFDGSIMNRHGGASIVIHDPWLGLVVAGGYYLFELTILAMELRGAWTGVTYTRRILYAEYLIIEDDSAIVVS